MSATAISSTSGFCEYAVRWERAMLPAPMTPTRKVVMEGSSSRSWTGSGEERAGVGHAALAGEQAVLPALELDGGVAGEVGLADRAGDGAQVDVAVADDGAPEVPAAAAAEPALAGSGVGRTDVEGLEVDGHRVGQVLGDGHLGRLIDAHEVAHVQGGAEVRLVDGVEDASHAVGGLHEEAVVLEARGDALGRGVLRDLLGARDDVRQGLLEGDGVVARDGGVRGDVVAHPGDAEALGEVHMGLHAADLGAVPGGEVRGDGEAG